MGVMNIIDNFGVCKGLLWFREVVKGGKHDGDLSRERVLILLDLFWNSASNSDAWRSSAETHSSYDDE
jgi:hypothetical protein